ncbi:MAG: response regulator [Desulfobacterales bacterium]|uniref:Response regulator n=1 Tax=Candidatus Desulfatibia vada TaxID=2841696 RepID=A0A8J6NRX2_9BACT|nr:response regulator [Candidatus Desulfatibia vada]MBL6972386.1 response regulator [Desulfobacterales bacterium]
MANNSIVLIVENDPSLRRILKIKFRNKGYQVYSARDGVEGHDLILKENPQVVITDIQMPNMDGKSLCEKTRELKKENPFLTIVITSLLLENHGWIDEMDETELMLKPLNLNELTDRVEQYLSGA